MAKNNYTRNYITYNPASMDLAGAITSQEVLNQRQRAEFREIEDINYRKKREEKLWEEKFWKDNFENQDYIDIGETNLNNFYANAIVKAMNEAGFLAMKGAKGSLTPQERVKLQMLNKTSDRLKALSGPVGDVVKKINEGSVHSNKDLNDFFKNIANGQIEFDEKGDFSIVVPSENNQPKKYSYNDMIKGIDGFNLLPKVDIFKLTDELTKNIKSVTKSGYKGYEDFKTKSIDPDFARQQAQAILFGTPGGTVMTNATKSWLLQNGYDPQKPNLKAIKDLENNLTERIINSEERIEELKFDRNAKASDANLAQRQKEHKDNMALKWTTENRLGAKEEREANSLGTKLGNIRLSELTNADNTTMSSATRSFGPLYKYRSIVGGEAKIGTLEGSNGKKYEDAVVQGYTYDKKTKSLVLDIEYSQGTESQDEKGNVIKGKKGRTSIKVNQATEAKVASLLGGNKESLRNSIMTDEQNQKEKISW